MIFADRRNLADSETKGCGLDQHLRVEDEVVAVLEKRNRLEKTTRVSAIPGVKLGQVQAEHAVLGPGQEAIADALPPRHAGLRRVEAKPPRAEHDVGLAVLDDAAEVRDDRWVVLAIGVQHDADISSHLARLAVARLLAPALAQIAFVADHLQPEVGGAAYPSVGTCL